MLRTRLMTAVVLLLAVPGAVWLTLAIHELGHVLAGRTQGFVFKLLAVGPLWVERSAGGHYTVRVNRTPLLWGGSTRSFPRDAENLIRRYAIFLAGGPIASAFLAVVAWTLELRCRPGHAQLFFSSLAVLSFLVFLGTAQPFGSGLGLSDGGAVRRLLGGGALAARDAALLALGGAMTAELRPRDWPAKSVDESLVPSDGSVSELVALTMAASYAADREDHARAATLSSRAWQVGEKHPRVLGSVALELALVAALGADAAQARRALRHVNGALVEDYAKLWVEAEVAALDGLADESRAKASAGIAAIGRAKLVKPTARDRERLQRLAAGGAIRARRA